MKIRNGFVSNSSSSSFMCDFCGDIESGYDCSLSDFNMTECEHGHTFHDCHAEKDFYNDAPKEEIYNFLKSKIPCSHYDDKKNLLKELDEGYNNAELERDDFVDNWSDVLSEFIEFDGVPEAYCPVCAKIKKFEQDPEYTEYLRLKAKFK